jgi:hypothetical protein
VNASPAVWFALSLAAAAGVVLGGLWLRRAATGWLARRLDLRCPQCRARITDDGTGPECENGHPLDEMEDECA